MIKQTILLSSALFSIAQADIVYQGETGAGKGKHLVMIASDHEYRAEETIPALAKILAKHHGFKCTVLFGTDENGFIEPGISNIPGIEKVANADGLVLFARFLDLPDEQMEHFVAYLDNGGPLVGLRTSSHAFKIKKGGKYEAFSFRAKNEEMPKGFGQKYLGNSWEGHYGKNHVQGTRTLIIPEKKDDPILTGVKDSSFCYAGGYGSKLFEGMEPLTHTQPLTSMDPNSEPDPEKPAVISSWKFSYKNKAGEAQRVFHSTQGASQDILDDSYRRLIINGIFWSVGLEGEIKADNKIDFIGEYTPSKFGLKSWKKNVKPSDLAPFDSAIGQTPKMKKETATK